jgi:hypothetical protein
MSSTSTDPTAGTAETAFFPDPHIGIPELDEAPETITETEIGDPTAGTAEEFAEALDGAREEAAAALPEALPKPLPIPIRYQLVRGRYRSSGAVFQLELRVDVDGHHPLRRVSGDFFITSGGTTSYFGSFVVHAPTITRTATHWVIRGLGDYTWTAGYPIVQVKIQRRWIGLPHPSAHLQFYNVANQPGASYLCRYVSRYFRTVQWEQDSVIGEVPFVSYDTGSLPQPPGSPARVLTVPKAYAEAGIELMVAGMANTVADNANGWTDGELHDAMEVNFSLWRDVPQWKVWLLVASHYETLAGVRGIMFDATDAHQRQGCAVFYDEIKGADPFNQRAQLRTYVHELGHAFNLLHSWQKDLATPPAPLGDNHGLADLSWMNYPQNYNPGQGLPGGMDAYWANFPFQFTDNELIHLRHGFYKNVIMGANAFGIGAADIDPEQFAEPLVDESGLLLELRAKDAFAFGEPVVVELKLGTTDLRGRVTHGFLHPNNDLVSVAIRQPSGRTVVYRPLLRRCVDENLKVRLDAKRPAIYSSAYIGYGRDGHYFQQPGTYLLRAAYIASDGSRVISPLLRLTVRHPVTSTDEQVAELMMGEEQGTLFTLLGSDSPTLKEGNEALQEVIERHGKHPFAAFARMVKGLNAEHEFKRLTPDKDKLAVRQPDLKESIQQLAPVVEASVQGKGVDNITLNMVMRRLACAQAKQGDLEEANTVLDRMVRHFTAKKLNDHVLERVRDQAETTKADLATKYGKRK